MKTVAISENYSCDGSEDLVLCDGTDIAVTLTGDQAKSIVIRKWPADSFVNVTLTAPAGKNLDGQGAWMLQNSATILPPDSDGNFWFQNYD